jgi:hypothetical protein
MRKFFIVKEKGSSMSKILFFLLLSASSVHAECELCKVIRAANEKLPPPKYEYYEDYLKAMKEEEAEKIDFSDDKKND